MKKTRREGKMWEVKEGGEGGRRSWEVKEGGEGGRWEVKQLAPNPGFSFRILSHSFGEKLRQIQNGKPGFEASSHSLFSSSAGKQGYYQLPSAFYNVQLQNHKI